LWCCQLLLLRYFWTCCTELWSACKKAGGERANEHSRHAACDMHCFPAFSSSCKPKDSQHPTSESTSQILVVMPAHTLTLCCTGCCCFCSRPLEVNHHMLLAQRSFTFSMLYGPPPAEQQQQLGSSRAAASADRQLVRITVQEKGRRWAICNSATHYYHQS
jgi:hypothetical protein